MMDNRCRLHATHIQCVGGNIQLPAAVNAATEGLCASKPKLQHITCHSKFPFAARRGPHPAATLLGTAPCFTEPAWPMTDSVMQSDCLFETSSHCRRASKSSLQTMPCIPVWIWCHSPARRTPQLAAPRAPL